MGEKLQILRGAVKIFWDMGGTNVHMVGTHFTQMGGESNFSGSNGGGQTSDGVDSPPSPPIRINPVNEYYFELS